MDNVLKQEMDNLKADVGKIGEKLDDLSESVREMTFALTGNKFTKDEGLIHRVIQLEADNKILEKRVEVLEAEKGKSDIYVRILWGAGGVVCTALIGFLLSILLKH